MKNNLSVKSIAIAYAQRVRRRTIATTIILDRGWWRDFLCSPYHSPVTYLRHRHGITLLSRMGWNYVYKIRKVRQKIMKITANSLILY